MASANSRTQTDWRPSVPRILMGLPIRTMPTSCSRIKSAEGLEVGALVGAYEVGQALGGDAERVAEGQADAFLAEVERQDAGEGGGQVHSIIDGAMIQSSTRDSQGSWHCSRSRWAQTRPKLSGKSRHVSLPIIALRRGDGGAVLRPHLLHHVPGRGDDRVHPGAVRGAADAGAIPAQPGELRGVHASRWAACT